MRNETPVFAELVYGTIDVFSEQTGWMRYEAVLAVEPGNAVRCLDVSGTDDHGVVHSISGTTAGDIAMKFIEALRRGRGYGIQQA